MTEEHAENHWLWGALFMSMFTAFSWRVECSKLDSVFEFRAIVLQVWSVGSTVLFYVVRRRLPVCRWFMVSRVLLSVDNQNRAEVWILYLPILKRLNQPTDIRRHGESAILVFTVTGSQVTFAIRFPDFVSLLQAFQKVGIRIWWWANWYASRAPSVTITLLSLRHCSSKHWWKFLSLEQGSSIL